jgi:DNA polymerase elongation subunit (family B)
MRAYVYDWSYYRNNIRIFCLNEHNETVCINVDNFTPYFYLELPETKSIRDLDDRGNCITLDTPIKWDEHELGLLEKHLSSTIFKSNPPLECSLKYRKKLYYANLDPSTLTTKYTKSLLCKFKNNTTFHNIKFRFNNPITIRDLGEVVLNIHEYHVPPVLQYTCQQDLRMSGWIEFEGEAVSHKQTTCIYEYDVSFDDIVHLDDETLNTPYPTILSFDIEVYSHNSNKFPNAQLLSDSIFQISCIFWRSESFQDNFLLTLGEIDHKIVEDDEKVQIQCFKDEASLIMGFINLIDLYNPQIITGWNIMGFDFAYLIERSNKFMLEDRLSCCGMVKNKKCEKIEQNWESSAYGKQSFRYYAWDGRVILDLLVYARREIKAENYKLETIASMFVDCHKDPIGVKDIFKSYEHGVLHVAKYGYEGTRLLSMVGKYCVKDSILVQMLFDKFYTWIGLVEMAGVCNVPASYLYTKGQQIKVFSQVYKFCYDNKFIVQQKAIKCKENEFYQGAYVRDPIPGVYNFVVPFDFASLYPTIMRAHNIDYSTFVIDENIPDEMCHIIEWDEVHEYDTHTCPNCDKFTRGQRRAGRNKLVTDTFITSGKCEHCGHVFVKTFEDIKTSEKTIVKKDKIVPPTDIYTDYYRYRFLKGPKGVLPTIAENLMNARNRTRKQMKELRKNNSANTNLLNILDKRQLSYKIACNSLYGAMGVREGSLPLMPGAMCVTALGRHYIKKAAEYLRSKYHVDIVYGDTDSVYINFPGVEPSKIWELARDIAKQLIENKVFPDPMILEFEDAVYDPFFILSKKRYMWRYYNEDGSRSEEIGNKGVLLARRGSGQFLKTIYETVTKNIFDGWNVNMTLDYIVDYINSICSSSLPVENFIITKKVGDIEGYDSSRSLPAHMIVAELMENRGIRVDIGQRIEYVITNQKDLKANVSVKAQDVSYQRRFSHIISIDYLYYIHLMSKPLDEILTVAFKLDKFMDKHYKLRVQKHHTHTELKHYFKPRICLLND